MPVKPPIVKARIRKVEECVADLQGIRKLPARAFFENRSVRAAAERLLQVAIQSVLDIGSHIIAERGFREADGYAEIIDILGEEGVLPKRFAARIRGMAGLRNILVHDYLEVDPAELRKHLGRLDVNRSPPTNYVRQSRKPPPGGFRGYGHQTDGHTAGTSGEPDTDDSRAPGNGRHGSLARRPIR